MEEKKEFQTEKPNSPFHNEKEIKQSLESNQDQDFENMEEGSKKMFDFNPIIAKGGNNIFQRDKNKNEKEIYDSSIGQIYVDDSENNKSAQLKLKLNNYIPSNQDKSKDNENKEEKYNLKE